MFLKEHNVLERTPISKIFLNQRNFLVTGKKIAFLEPLLAVKKILTLEA